jgi:Ca-activated chloride channel family protein
MLEQFHFLQPLWFLALLPLVLLWWWLPRSGYDSSDWQHACESHLLPYLLNKPMQTLNRLPIWLLSLAWLLAIVALADPVWQKQPQPVYRNQDAVVVVLDLSRSMLSKDLTPSRLERARYKVADILKQRNEGLTGFVVFAGDAFTVSPLTNDTKTILSLLNSLNPELMPAQGSRADLGIRQAGNLLKQAGLNRGNILLINDGYSDPHTLDIASDLYHQGYRISVLGVGSNEPTPIPNPQGGFVQDASGQVVLPTLDITKLQQLSHAGGGRYSTITSNDTDLASILPVTKQTLDSQIESTEQATDRWQSQGPWLVLLLLPLATLAFRRGWLLILPLLITATLGGLPQPVMASGWDNLWLRSDQQADLALQNGDYKNAQQLADQPLQRGEAAYRAGDYVSAVNDFKESNTAQGHYNRGNALAQLGRYQEAINAYDQALSSNPEMADASHNKQELEKLLKQQQQQQQQQKDDKNSGDKAEREQAESKSTDKQNGSDNNAQQANKQKESENSVQQNSQSADKQNGSDDKEQQNAQQADDKNSADEVNHLQTNSPSNNKQDNGDNKTQADSQQADKQNGNDGQQQESAQLNKSQSQSENQASARQQTESEKISNNENQQQNSSSMKGTQLDTADLEQQQADERWLRRIPDDPGGLLRRKFLYQYSQRGSQQDGTQPTW